MNDVAIDPNNYNTVFATDNNQVFMSSNGGTSWSDITGNLGLFSSLNEIRTAVYVPGAAPYLAVGTRSGVFASLASNPGAWVKLGTVLPDALVFDLVYNATDDVLIAGTFGRGVWTMLAASTVFATPPNDFGDAPDSLQSGFASSYPVTTTENGAKHTATGPTLGANRDSEADGAHSLNADADDMTGLPDDEDGITFAGGTILVSRTSTSTGTVSVNLQNADAASNRLDAWIDWNRDGDWNDADEQIFANFDLGVSNGTQSLSFAIPNDTGINVQPGTTYARFRLSTAGGLATTGAAANGEVEDLSVSIMNQPEGTAGNDAFVLTYSASTVTITNGAVSLGTFPVAVPLRLYGLGGTDSVKIVGTTGSDLIQVTNFSSLLINGSELTLDSTESLLLAGGAGNDTYGFDADNPVGLISLDEAGGGIDSLDFSLTTTNPVTINLGLATTQTVNANLSLNLKSTATFDNVLGGSGSDLITGNGLANVLAGGNGEDTLLGSTGNDVLDGGAGNDTQDGGSGNDTYQFDAYTALGTETLSDAVGVDSISFLGTSADIVFSLGTTATQSMNGGLLSLTLSSATIIDNLTGGDGSDTLTGNTVANTLVGGAGNDLLNGGAGNDIYLFDADSSLGSDILTDATGTETISFAGTSAGTILSLVASGTQTVNGNLSITLPVPTTFDNLIGGNGNDNLTGNSGANQLTGGSGNDSLNGGTGNDTFLIDADTALGTDALADDGGTDLISFVATTTKAVILNLGVAGTTQVVNSNLSLILSTATAFENVIGGTLANTLTGNGLANSLTGGAAGDALSGAGGNDTLIGGGGNDTLNGGSGDDKYVFDADLVLGSDTIDESTGSGIDTLEFVLTTTAGLAVDLSTSLLQTVVPAKLSLTIVSADSTIEDVIGGSQNDLLTGNSLSNTLTGNGGSDVLSGAAGDDVYRFDVDVAQGADTLIDSAGTDTLDFILSTLQGISVDLSSGATQTVQATNLTLTIAASEIENVLGTSKNDTITGNNLPNVLVGGAGNDILNGGDGADVLIGGAGNDTINGGPGEDLLIAGTTSFDLQIPKLMIIQQVWSGPDPYSTRVTTLRAGVSGVALTAKTTVLNSGVDSMTGGDQQDWFFRSLDDVITDLFAGELTDLL